MKGIKKVFNRLCKKPVLASITIIFFIIASLYTADLYDYYFPELNTEAVSFFLKEKAEVPDSENVFYAILGLNAPANVNDIHAFGLNLRDETLDHYATDDHKFIPRDIKPLDFENSINLEVDAKKLVCWLQSEAVKIEQTDKEECYTRTELLNIIEFNEIFLKRHEELKKYKMFDSDLFFSRNGKLLINIHRLFLADLRIKLDIEPDKVISVLINDIKYFRLLINQRSGWVSKAINIVLYELSLQLFEVVVFQYTESLEKYLDEISDILTDFSISEFNIDGVFKEEFENLNTVYCIDQKLSIDTNNYCVSDVDTDSINVNFIVNDYYRNYLRYERFSNLNIRDIKNECSLLQQEMKKNTYLDMFFHLPIINTYKGYGIMVTGDFHVCPVIENYMKKNNRLEKLRNYLSSSFHQ